MTSKLIYYTYAYLRSKDSKTAKAGTPYYIGKGKGNRAYGKHHKGVSVPSDKKYIVFVETHLTELGSLAIERKLIRWHGRKDNHTGILINLTDGGEGVSGRIGKPNSTSFKKGLIPWSKGKNMPTVSTSKKLFWLNWHKNNTKKERIYIKIGVSDTSRKMYSDNITAKNTESISCPHCNFTGQGYANLHRWHFDKCTHNPDNIIILIQCPYCDMNSRNKANMKRYHFENCKLKI